MIQETIATDRDVNAAIDNGCRELGINREEDLFDFEIIAREKKGFLGLKTYPAKVRVFREVPDPKPVVREEKPKAEPPAPGEKTPGAPSRPPQGGACPPGESRTPGAPPACAPSCRGRAHRQGKGPGRAQCCLCRKYPADYGD